MKSAILLLLCATAVCADDGMWLFNQFPADAVKQKSRIRRHPGVPRPPAPVDCDPPRRIRRFRLSQRPGAHQLAHRHQLRSQCRGLARPFSRHRDAEVRCPGLDAKVLLAMEDVTAKVKAGITDDTPVADALTKRNTAIAAIESECAAKPHNVCNVVNFYSGGRYDLYQYRRYDDLRLVFAPEQQLAFFGRERDSFNYLRYGLDAAFLRAYENGKPAATPNFLKWNNDTVKDGDLVFADASPLATSRSTTVAQLNFYRDTALPLLLSRVGRASSRLPSFPQ